MKSNYAIYFEVVIVGLLLAIPWSGPQQKRPHCSRDQANLVRKVVMKRWVPILQKVGASLPLHCPLHPTRDLFYPQEIHKKHEAPEWTCGLCGQDFYKESHLDAHMEDKHPDYLSQQEDATCLADFCDVIRCDVISAKLRELEETNGNDEDGWPKNFLLSTRKLNIDQAIVAMRPRSLMVSSSSGHSTSQTDAQKITDSKTTSNLPDVEKTSNDEKEPCKNDQICQDNEDNHNSSEQEGRTPEELPIHPLNSWRDTCNEEQLAELRVKCQLLIQQCISGLVLNLTLEQVKGVEVALHRTVCWYLTCDRYWEAGSMEPTEFPWGIATFFVLLLSLGVSFSYYVVWVLCDSSNETPVSTPVSDDPPSFTSQSLSQRSPSYRAIQSTSKTGSLGRHQASTSRAKYSATESESECRDSGFNEGGIFPEVAEMSGPSYLEYENSRARHYSGDSRHSAPQDDQRYYMHEERFYNYASTFTPNYEKRRLKRNRYNYLDDFDAYADYEQEEPAEPPGIPRERSDSFIYVSYPPEIKKKFLENR